MNQLHTHGPPVGPSALAALVWPLERLSEALALLAKENGLQPLAVAVPPPPATPIAIDEEALQRWVQATAAFIGVEAEPVAVAYDAVHHFLRFAAPAILHLPVVNQPGFLLVAQGGRRRISVIRPDGLKQTISLATVRNALCQRLEAPLATELDQILNNAQIPERRRAHTGAAILKQRLRSVNLKAGWLVRVAPNAPFRLHVQQSKLLPQLWLLAGVYLLRHLCWLGSWYVIGQAVLSSTFDADWLLGWALLLVTLAPLRSLLLSIQGRIAVQSGILLKMRLLYGSLRLHPDDIRHQGVGQLLGRVIESEVMETLAVHGGFFVLFALIELLLAGLILTLGAGGILHAGLLVGWLIFAAYLARNYYQLRRQWTNSRLELTHGLVEQMVGHRTRLAQASPTEWHTDEDWSLASYAQLSGQMDRSALRLMALVTKGWLVVGLLGLGPFFVTTPERGALLAVAVGGILSAYAALRSLVNGFLNLVGAIIAWQQIQPMFAAAEQPYLPGHPTFALARSQTNASTAPVVQASDLLYRYRLRSEPILHNCHLTIYAGERVLLEGVSGGGKSTLAALLAGLRQPTAGLILLGGFDHATLGEAGWHQAVTAALQFHENHVLTETFAFNLLMGRSWPPSAVDLQMAEEVCQELGLGDLLARMPGGLFQLVGDTGWQLSHGERSRLFIARALLQNADLLIFDESFAALDPENLQRALECVCRRAATLLIIAHP